MIGEPDSADRHERLLGEQIEYYRAIAPEYHEHALPLPGAEELRAVVDSWRPSGRLLELACGQGLWTERLVRHDVEVTAVDASPEMLAIAARRPGTDEVRFIRADIFEWVPDRQFDAIFFGFWLSHVPPARFASFWSSVRACLAPGGEVLFVDDSHRDDDEIVGDASSPVVRRRLKNGDSFEIVKAAYGPGELEGRLAGLGWRFRVHPTAGPFYWGIGTASATPAPPRPAAW